MLTTTLKTEIHPRNYKNSSSCNFVTAGRVEEYAYYHIPNMRIQLLKTLLMMDRWSPKRVELTQVLNKLTHWNTLCILLDGLHIYIINYLLNMSFHIWIFNILIPPLYTITWYLPSFHFNVYFCFTSQNLHLKTAVVWIPHIVSTENC